MDKLISFITELASTESECDTYFDVGEYAGGNMDDAYNVGREHGRISLARELSKLILEDK